MKSKNLTIMQIQEEIDAFVNKRDRVVHKGSRKKSVYSVVHMVSNRGNYPLCHLRPALPQLTDRETNVDCLFCLKAIEEDK